MYYTNYLVFMLLIVHLTCEPEANYLFQVYNMYEVFCSVTFEMIDHTVIIAHLPHGNPQEWNNTTDITSFFSYGLPRTLTTI